MNKMAESADPERFTNTEPKTPKKYSPSKLKRNQLRLQEFLDKKRRESCNDDDAKEPVSRQVVPEDSSDKSDLIIHSSPSKECTADRSVERLRQESCSDLNSFVNSETDLPEEMSRREPCPYSNNSLVYPNFSKEYEEACEANRVSNSESSEYSEYEDDESENEKLCKLAEDLLRRMAQTQKGLRVTIGENQHDGFYMKREFLDDLFVDETNKWLYVEFKQELGIHYDGSVSHLWIPPNCVERIWNFMMQTLSELELGHLNFNLELYQFRNPNTEDSSAKPQQCVDVDKP